MYICNVCGLNAEPAPRPSIKLAVNVRKFTSDQINQFATIACDMSINQQMAIAARIGTQMRRATTYIHMYI